MLLCDIALKVLPHLVHFHCKSACCMTITRSSRKRTVEASTSKEPNKKKSKSNNTQKLSKKESSNMFFSKKSTNKDSSVSKEKLMICFAKYADEDDEELMSMEGISRVCDVLNIDPSVDVRALMLFWRLGSNSKPG